MSANDEAMLAAIVTVSEGQWSVMDRRTAVRYVYELQRLRNTLMVRTGDVVHGADNDTATLPEKP